MRKMGIFFILGLLFVSLPGSTYAHPPADIAITFDNSAKMLKAVIYHPVSNPEGHFIKKVDVGLNGREVIEHTLSRQDNFNTQTVIYLIPDAKPGDTLSVEAYCSISGKLNKEIKINK